MQIRRGFLQNKMKALFLTTGIGYGHPIRDVAIIKELLSRDPNTKIMIAGYKNSYVYFNNKYPTIEIDGPEFPDYSFRLSLTDVIASNLFLPLHYIKNFFKLNKVIKEFKPDIIVSDFEPIGIILARYTKTKYITLFNFDPREYEKFKNQKNPSLNVRMQEPYISQVYNASKQGSLIIVTLKGNQKTTVKYKFISPIIRKAPEELASERELIKKLSLKRKPILIMLGGSNFGISLINSMLDVLEGFDEEFIIFGYENHLKLKRNVDSYSFKPNFLEYLKICKGVITLAGHNTLSECLVYKKPMLVFPVKDHLEQLVNAFNVEDNAVVKYLDEPSPDKIKNAIKEFLSKRKQLEENLVKLDIKASGAKEVVDIIEKMVNS